MEMYHMPKTTTTEWQISFDAIHTQIDSTKDYNYKDCDTHTHT